MIYNYDPIKAVEYAKTYWQNYNPEYPDWHPLGGDCANFVSQCLIAGGIKKNGVPEKNPASDFAYWYSYGNKADINLVSSTWRGAGAFKYYWEKNASEVRIFDKFSEETYNYGKIGDFLSLINPSTNQGYHTMIIIDYGITEGVNDLLCAQHSPNLINASLLKKNKGFIIYKLLPSPMPTS